MKKLSTNEIWDEPSFMTIKLEYQLIERYMFDKVADRMGVAFMNQDFLEWRFKIAITKLEELIDAISPWWVAFKPDAEKTAKNIGSYFIRKDFITQTQGGAIYLTSAPHQPIFAEMVRHKKNGFNDVVKAVRQANPELEVQTMKEAKKDYDHWQSIRQSNPNSHKSNGYKQNIDAFEKNRRNFKYLGITDFPPINDGFELEIDKQFVADPLKPDEYPDQTVPLDEKITQERHDVAISQGWYMQTNGDYAKPLKSNEN